MPSATEQTIKSQRRSRLWAQCKRWNRKLHFYSGLFLLLFLWLFAVTGLILNHPAWTIAESWNNRKETNYEQVITAPGPELKGDLSQAREIMRQLGIEGEILWTTTRTNPSYFTFQVRRPGDYYFLSADLGQQRVTIRHVVVNLWGVSKVLHTFTGVQLDDARQSRHWVLTFVWAYTMDFVAVGLIFMVLSSLYMWWELPQKRLPGAVALGLGSLICGLFCLGLRWLF
jgi:hypothetical protein